VHEGLLSTKGDENGNHNRAVGELRADHPLDEVDLEFLQIILCGEVGSIEFA